MLACFPAPYWGGREEEESRASRLPTRQGAWSPEPPPPQPRESAADWSLGTSLGERWEPAPDSGPRVGWRLARFRFVCYSGIPFPATAQSPAAPLQTRPPQTPGGRWRSPRGGAGLPRCSLPCGARAGCSGPSVRCGWSREPGDATPKPHAPCNPSGSCLSSLAASFLVRFISERVEDCRRRVDSLGVQGCECVTTCTSSFGKYAVY